MSGSNNQLTYEEAVDSLEAYALDAMDTDEVQAVEQYLQAHPDLQKRADDLSEITALLAHAAPPRRVPASLKAGILSRARTSLGTETDSAPVTSSDNTASLLSESDVTYSGSATPAVQTTHRHPFRAPASRPVAPIQAAAQEREPWWAWLVRPRTWQLATAALAMVLVIVTGTALHLRTIAFDLQGQLAAAEQEVASLRTTNNGLLAERDNTLAELTVVRTQLSEEMQHVQALTSQFDLLVQPDRTITLALNDSAAGEGLRGSFYASGSGGVLLLNGLPPLPSDQTYELWLIPDGGDAVPAGLFNSTAATTGTGNELTIISEDLPLDPEEYSTVGISIEPAGGSQSPTGPIVLLGSQA